jgi:hypothetical protein
VSTRRAALQAAGVALAALALPGVVRARGPGHGVGVLPQSVSLAAELAAALAARKGLVVMASLEGCPYCRIVRESYLLGMRAEGQPVVQVEMAASAPLVDLQGRASTHQQVVRALGVRVAPTVLFFGPGGKEVAPRIAGMPIPDFYGAYLQERVEAANRAAGA